MKRKLVLIFGIFMLLCSGCVNFFPGPNDGIWESETPKMRIDMGSGAANKYGVDGEITQEIDDIIKIKYAAYHGNFTIHEYKEFQENEMPGVNTPILYKGKYRQKGNTLILKCDDGSEIVLKKVEDSTSSSQ